VLRHIPIPVPIYIPISVPLDVSVGSGPTNVAVNVCVVECVAECKDDGDGEHLCVCWFVGRTRCGLGNDGEGRGVLTSMGGKLYTGPVDERVTIPIS